MRISIFCNGKLGMVSSCESAYILFSVFSDLFLYSMFQYVVIQTPWLMPIYKNLCKYLRTESNNVQVKQCVSEYWNDVCQETVEFGSEYSSKGRSVSHAACNHYFNTIWMINFALLIFYKVYICLFLETVSVHVKYVINYLCLIVKISISKSFTGLVICYVFELCTICLQKAKIMFIKVTIL